MPSSQAFGTAVVWNRPNNKTSFPIAIAARNKTDPKATSATAATTSKTPMIKKGSTTNDRFLRERLRREKRRLRGVAVATPTGAGSSGSCVVGFGSSASVSVSAASMMLSPTSTTSSSDSSTPLGSSGNHTFRTRFECRPVTFKIAPSTSKNTNSCSNNSNSNSIVGSRSGILPCTKFRSPTTPGRRVRRIRQSTITSSPRTTKRGIRQGRIQVSPPTIIPTPTAPPSAAKANAKASLLLLLHPSHNTEKAVPKGSVPQPPTATAAAAKFVERAVHEVSQPQAQAQAASFDSEDFDDNDNDVASLLCLVPMVCKISDEGEDDDDDNADKGNANGNDAAAQQTHKEVSCYWPCLVFSGLETAMLCHARLYPKQSRLQRKLQKKFAAKSLAAANNSNINNNDDDDDAIENQNVVLPLGNAQGCCPKDFCGRPLYDAIDKTTSSSSSSSFSSSSNRYWTTRAKKKGCVIEKGKTVVRLLEDFHVVGSYLKESKRLIPTVGVALEQALMEMERLSYLDDSTSSTSSSSSDNDEDDTRRPFVSSLRAASISEDEEHEHRQLQLQEQEPIRFPMHSPVFEKPRWSRSRRSKAATTPTPTATTTNNNNNNNNNTAAIQFPKSSQKSRKRPSPSISPDKKNDGNNECPSEPNSIAGTKGAMAQKNGLQKDRTTPTATAQDAPVIQPTKKARTSSATAIPTTTATTTATTATTTNKKKTKRGRQKKATVIDNQGTNSTTAISTTTTKTKKDWRSKKKPTVIDSQGRISVSSWAAVKPLLEQLGHVFFEEENREGSLVQHYCRPNGDPRENPESSEGEDYFVSLSSYRAHLCAKGVEYFGTNYSETKSPLEEDDLELIAYWVRFHIFTHRDTGGRKSETIPDLELPRKGKYVKVLQRIGYKFTYGALEEGYVIPGAKTKLYLSEKELWEHLGKHGLSPSCKFEKFVSKEEQMAVEIQCIRKYHGNHGDKAFRPIRKSDPVVTNDHKENGSEYQECSPAANKDALEVSTRGSDEGDGQEAMSPRNLDNQANYSKDQECTPAANKDALEECTRGPDVGDGQEAMSPRKLMTEEIETNTNYDDTTFSTSAGPSEVDDEMNLEESADTAFSNAADSANLKGGNGGANQDTRRNENMDVSIESRDTTAEANVAAKQPMSTNGTTPQAEVVLEQPRISREEVTIDEVDIPGTKNGEKLSACLVNLRKNEIVAHGQLSNSIGRIRSFVDTVIESKGRKGDGTGSNKTPILYLCGNPGTGKTMSTTKICQDAIAAKSESKEEWEKDPRVCHISCPSLQNFKYQQGMRKVMERMGMKSSQLKRSANDDINSAKILILDEVDQLLGSKGTEAILKQLSSWAKDEGYLLSIIGISNAVYNTKTNRLMEYGMGGMSNKLVFETYQKKDLVTMSQAKIGFSVVDKKAHEFIAAKVANSSGDARQYLELVEKAIIYCRRKLSLEKLETAYTKPIVTIRDAMFSIRETNRKSKDTIQSLTSIEKMTLCAGVHLARKLGGKTVQMGKLRTLTMQAFGMDNDVSLEEFKGVIERLQDNGLLQLNESERQAFTKTKMFNLLRYPVQFDLQLEDVDSALEDTLMKEDFYKRMVERLKTISV